jgi:glycosyltransferase involved in cell wall biosynthesis
VVDLVGRLDADERDRELAGAAVMLLPSVREGWGLAVIEAALQGTPAVAYRSAGGVGESVRHDETGLLVDSAAELERAVERLVTEPELRHRLSQSGREWALSFDWDETATAVEALVDNLADGQVAGLP